MEQRSLQGIVEHARASIGTHQAVASLTDVDGTQTIVGLSLSDKYAAYRTYNEKPRGTGIYSLVCRDNKPMRMTQEQIESHPAWQDFGLEKGRHPPMRGWLAVPIIGLDSRSIGILQLSDKYDGEFTGEDETVLCELAELAAAVTERDRLVEAIRRTTHEFDNLLTVVTGFSELLLRQPNLTGTAQAFITEIKTAGDKATLLLLELCKSCGVQQPRRG